MQRFIFLTSSLFFMLLLMTACGGDTPENAFPKRLPVDERAKKQQVEALSEQSKQASMAWQEERERIDAILESSGNFYATADGVDELTKEYTTYYLEEDKTTPLKTRYIYKTGSFDLLYWLPNGQLWLERDGYDFLIKDQKIVHLMRDGQVAEATTNERQEALKVAAMAAEQVQPVNYPL